MSEEQVDLAVYLALVALTVLTVGASVASAGRALAIALALSVASMKAALIALYFMHLRREEPLIHAVVLTGVVAILILAVGILPDAAFRW